VRGCSSLAGWALVASSAEILSYGKRSNVQALAGRLTGVTRWLIRHPAVCGLPVGYFGASAAAAAALWAAAAVSSASTAGPVSN